MKALRRTQLAQKNGNRGFKNHLTKQSNGWFLSCTFAIPLRYILWQKCNLKTIVYCGANYYMKSEP